MSKVDDGELSAEEERVEEGNDHVKSLHGAAPSWGSVGIS
jgi:hypothetical protein